VRRRLVGDELVIRLNDSIKTQFENLFESYNHSLSTTPISNEEDFIDRTVQAFQNFQAQGDSQSLRTRSVKLHGKPLVSFRSSLALPSSQIIQRELADLLFVYKHLIHGQLDAYRASLVQTKLKKETAKSWSIEAGQFWLMNYWPAFRISKPAKSSKTYHIEPKNLSWALYGFVSPTAAEHPVYYSSRRILRAMGFSIPSSHHFSFALHRMRQVWVYNFGLLSKLLQGLVGENLLSNIVAKTLIEDFYKLANLIPDPSGEFQWDNEKSEEEKGLGIIEFTLKDEGRYERPPPKTVYPPFL